MTSKLILIAAAMLAGCIMPDRVVKLYEDTDFDGGPFSNVLVVGAHEDSDARRRFESSVVRSLNASGTDATSSIEVMGSGQDITRESLLAATSTSGSDAVLITRLVDVQSRAEIQQGRTTVVADRRGNLPLAGFFRYDYTEYQDPMTVTTVRTVVLATDLYNVDDENRIWSVESTSFDKETVDATIDGASRAISTTLLQDGLIR